MNLQKATFGGGCFWCTEAVFQQVKGVQNVISGYAGGEEKMANYEAVCSGTTRHAEVIQIEFDADQVSYTELLEIFFTTHDPTTPNRQGNDRGPQYRSVIFHHDEEQKQAAQKAKKDYAPQVWNDPIVTEITPLAKFYVAEQNHQNYYNKVGNRNPYCTFVITPKVSKFRKKFADKMKT
ncbi:MAG TPA: peptide-methionine (S)-S-oxide reductase MsrA [Saprospiraceae bacterium]|nr:peptide-methionine (S)-S-oxide reductase MsrA [Saprospiraceae bacterium]